MTVRRRLHSSIAATNGAAARWIFPSRCRIRSRVDGPETVLEVEDGCGGLAEEDVGEPFQKVVLCAAMSGWGRHWRVLGMAGASLALLAAATAVLLVIPPTVPSETDFDLDLAATRRLALSDQGPLPVRVNTVVVAESVKPMVGALGGCRTDSFVMPWTVFQIVYDDSFLLVDSAGDRALHDEGASGGAFHADRYAATQDALRQAAVVLFTHEHPDHLGGAARSPQLAEVAPRMRLTREQLADASALDAAGLPPEVAAALVPLVYDTHLRIAPGVVLIKAPGHTPGSQLVYVHLRNGAELLLVGDIAWHRAHVEEPRGHPRLSAWLLGEDLSAVLGQLRALHDAWRNEGIVVVPSHDGEHVRRLIAAGVLGSELVRAPPAPTPGPPGARVGAPRSR